MSESYLVQYIEENSWVIERVARLEAPRESYGFNTTVFKRIERIPNAKAWWVSYVVVSYLRQRFKDKNVQFLGRVYPRLVNPKEVYEHYMKKNLDVFLNLWFPHKFVHLSMIEYDKFNPFKLVKYILGKSIKTIDHRGEKPRIIVKEDFIIRLEELQQELNVDLEEVNNTLVYLIYVCRLDGIHLTTMKNPLARLPPRNIGYDALYIRPRRLLSIPQRDKLLLFLKEVGVL